MSLSDYVNRTKTFISGDWTGDQDLISKLKEWNHNKNLGLSFVDVHEVTQSSDTSLFCSIKKSLRQRLNISKTFILIIGRDTKTLTKGSCRYCGLYQTGGYFDPYCLNRGVIDNRSYIQFECEMAVKDYSAGELKKIVVIYNGRVHPDKSLCPDVIKHYGVHIGSDIIGADGKRYWDYQGIKNAICE